MRQHEVQTMCSLLAAEAWERGDDTGLWIGGPLIECADDAEALDRAVDIGSRGYAAVRVMCGKREVKWPKRGAR